MNLLHRIWLRHLRFWHTIDLDAALQTENWDMATDCRLRIAECDRQIDGLAL
jgi:hypothetical protein